jgi:hypothetical protein
MNTTTNPRIARLELAAKAACLLLEKAQADIQVRDSDPAFQKAKELTALGWRVNYPRGHNPWRVTGGHSDYDGTFEVQAVHSYSRKIYCFDPEDGLTIDCLIPFGKELKFRESSSKYDLKRPLKLKSVWGIEDQEEFEKVLERVQELSEELPWRRPNGEWIETTG